VKILISLFFVICLVTSSIAPTVDGMHSTVNEDLALERQLNIVNKSHIKSTHVFIYTHIWIFYSLNLISIFNNSIFVLVTFLDNVRIYS
jgi:hypothetical protein